jgi:hypothetical protein
VLPPKENGAWLTTTTGKKRRDERPLPVLNRAHVTHTRLAVEGRTEPDAVGLSTAMCGRSQPRRDRHLCGCSASNNGHLFSATQSGVTADAVFASRLKGGQLVPIPVE